jgi:hypothetical protein
MKLEPSVNFVSVGKTQLPSGAFGNSFVMEKNLRYIDLQNINKYNKKQLMSILTSVGIFTNPSYKKDVLISFLMRNEEAINKIKEDNREWKLNQLITE